MEYNFTEIEQRARRYWKEHEVYTVTNDTTKPKFYVLDMFPYPSGAGLHVGHPLGYIASDIYARYKRLKGFNVLHPMGFDAFGLPAEQYALETGQHPAVTTDQNIKRYKEQLDNIGFCFDWSREVRTSDPEYYKWTQWIFLQLFHSWYDRRDGKARPISELVKEFEEAGNEVLHLAERKIGHQVFNATQWHAFTENEKRQILMSYRLAYLDYAQVWWCETLGTVLANDEVVNGVSERGGFPVERKEMRQWFLRITEFADRLLDSLDKLEWSEAMKEMQRNWIGKSKGATVKFFLDYESDPWQQYHVNVFTTRPDTIFGVDFLVLAPEHHLVDSITTDAQKDAVAQYVQYVKSRSERERQAEVKNVTGCFTGAYAVHPLDEQRKVPIWISEYVLAGYGTGAIMAVPAGDDRDHRFAKHFNIEITNIFGDRYTGDAAYTDKSATIENSGFITGKTVAEAQELVITELEHLGKGTRQVNYRLRDAGFSRQRYWGEPFPIVYINGVPYGTDELNDTQLAQLPVELPHVDSYKPGPEGQGPLANIGEWVRVELSSPPAPLHEWRGEQPGHSATPHGSDTRTVTPSPLAERGPGGEVDKPYGNSPKYKVNLKNAVPTARANRRAATEAEDALWQRLRGSKTGSTFRRQHPIESYIVDFVCLQNRLIVEVDGGYHNDLEQINYDTERTKVLEAVGFRVMRFTNEQVLEQINDVVDAIRRELSSPPAPLHEWKGEQPGHAATPHGPDTRTVTPSPLAERGPEGEVASRETNTMPGYAGSSWYFLRYMDPHNAQEFASRAATDYWQQVDLYVGGTEHAVGHLLYSRMWTKALHDLGHISFDEPFKRLLNQGMIQGSSRFVYRVKGTNTFVSAGLKRGYDVDEIHADVNIVDGVELDVEAFKKWRPDFADAEFILEDGKYICGEEVEKMSKSKYNVVNPDDIVAQYGADTFRMYEMFLGPIEISKPWDTKGIEGVHRFIRKFWRLYADEQKGWIVNDEAATPAELKILHKTIKKITDDIERFSFNTSVSQFMITVNELAALDCHKRAILEPLVVLICPFAPHLAEELWRRLGNSGSVVSAMFPQLDEQYLVENTKVYPVAVNGKPRAEMEFALDAAQAEIEQAVLSDPAITKWTEGKPPKKFIYVKRKMINVVV